MQQIKWLAVVASRMETLGSSPYKHTRTDTSLTNTVDCASAIFMEKVYDSEAFLNC